MHSFGRGFGQRIKISSPWTSSPKILSHYIYIYIYIMIYINILNALIWAWFWTKNQNFISVDFFSQNFINFFLSCTIFTKKLGNALIIIIIIIIIKIKIKIIIKRFVSIQLKGFFFFFFLT